MAVVEVIKSGKARDPILGACARNLWLMSAIYNIHICITHISGTDNTVADLLSRWQNTQYHLNKLAQFIPNFVWIPVHLDLTKINYNI